MKFGLGSIPIILLLMASLIVTSCSSDKTKADEEGPAVHSDYEHDGMDNSHKEYETADHINTDNLSNNSVPEDVLNNFQNKYVNVGTTEWSQTDSGYTASFKQEGKDYQAHFNKQGQWVNSQSSMKYDELPTEIKNSFSKNKLHKDSLESIQMNEIADGTKSYSMQFRQDAKKQELGNLKIEMDEKGQLQNSSN